MVRVLTSLMIAAAVLASTAGCGSHGAVAQGPGITLFQPTTLYSNGSSALRILGKGFGARKSKVTVRFTATAGTPFANGTSATFQTEATVDSDSQVRGTAPASFANADVDATVEVILADGSVIASDGPVTNIVFQQILGMTPPSVSSGVTPPFTITGQGFQPPLGLVTVRFTSIAGTPFAGGSSASITTIGTVENDTTITGLFPDGQVAFDTDATVTVILPDGAQISSSGPLVHWIPIPTVVAFSPSTIPGGQMVPFTVTGTAYAPSGSTATITLEAVTGTPFFGGTSSTVSFPGTVIGPTEIDGTTPPLNPSVAGLAYVRVTLQGGSTAISATPLVQFVPPPQFTSFSPSSFSSGSLNPWQTAGPNTSFSIIGQNFGSPGASVIVTFTASTGTPFNNGTSATFVATGTVVSNTALSGSFADPLASGTASGGVSLLFPSGATTGSAGNVWTVTKLPPVTLPAWSSSALSGTISGVSDDSATSVSFAGGFTFPYYGTSYSTGFANSNGSFSFGGGSTDFTPSTTEFTAAPARLAPFWGDLSPNSSTFFWNTTAHSDRGVLSWNNSDDFNGTGTISMQIHMYQTGRVDYVYNGASLNSGGLIGVSPGAGSTSQTTDWSNVNHPSNATFGTGIAPNEILTAPDLGTGGWILYYPAASGGFDWASN